MTSPTDLHVSDAQRIPGEITGVQPGGGWVARLEIAWGRFRRRWLQTFRPAYVARMRVARRGDCPDCPHEVIDARDLKFCRNVCGFWFAAADDPFAWRGRLFIARMGWAEVILFGAGAAALAAALAFLFPWLAPVPALAALFVLSFFRDPPRRVPGEPGAVVSPADGRVTDITPIEWLEEFQGPAVRIGIYLSIFNVHVNRCPDAARVVAVHYQPGRFFNSRRPEASALNERFSTLLESAADPGRLMLMRQIAGAFASRVVNEVRPGQVLARGEKIGMIKFGSRTELFLSAAAGGQILVRPGDRLRGGVSVIVRYPL